MCEKCCENFPFNQVSWCHNKLWWSFMSMYIHLYRLSSSQLLSPWNFFVCFCIFGLYFSRPGCQWIKWTRAALRAQSFVICLRVCSLRAVDEGKELNFPTVERAMQGEVALVPMVCCWVWPLSSPFCHGFKGFCNCWVARMNWAVLYFGKGYRRPSTVCDFVMGQSRHPAVSSVGCVYLVFVTRRLLVA